MLIQCNNKGCMTLTEALYDDANKHVLCVDCGSVIAGVTVPMMRALKGAGQIVRTTHKEMFDRLNVGSIAPPAETEPKVAEKKSKATKKKVSKKTTKKKTTKKKA